MGLNYYASSAPTLVLTPNQQNHYFGGHYQDHQSNNSIMNAAALADPPSSTTMTDLPISSASSAATTTTLAASRKPMRPRFPRPPSINYLATSGPLSGRKRSIADVTEDEPHSEGDGSYVSPTGQPPSPPKPRGEPVYGPGMTLIYPDDPGFSIAAESQTGTWAEEKNERAEVEASEAMSRPPVISRKSQRLIEPDSIAVETSITPIASSFTKMNGRTSSSPDSPVDHLSITLGIGWKRIPSSQAPAAKGWEKYIVNHYDNILDPTILSYNEGLRVYLVRSLSSTSDTQECWWIFQEDLSACRLIGFCEADAIRNIQRGETMGPTIPAQAESRQACLGGVEQTPAAMPVAASGNGDVEMEM